ncbi:MAG: hypothetical protein HZB37_03570 [Planctomycetes bacterium]|nr:hypothetical protein [Planctomycetota bacterium]
MQCLRYDSRKSTHIKRAICVHSWAALLEYRDIGYTISRMQANTLPILEWVVDRSLASGVLAEQVERRYPCRCNLELRDLCNGLDEIPVFV